jgi:hypothetical protein
MSSVYCYESNFKFHVHILYAFKKDLAFCRILFGWGNQEKSIMAAQAHCAIHQTIVRLTGEIQRIRQAQRLIACADRALRAGRDDVLRNMGFGIEHIEELKRAAALSHDSAFPKFVRRNNALMVGFLRREVATLQRYFCACSVCVAKNDRDSTARTISDGS